jgi:ankyrin repeat protein
MNSLWIYAMLGNCTEVEKLLAEGLDINSVNEKGSTAIMEAAHHAELKMVEFLLARNAHLDVRNLLIGPESKPSE